MSEGTNFYDRSFRGWLERRTKRPSQEQAGSAGFAPKRYARIDVNQLLRGSFNPRDLARLDALGYAR